MNINRIINKEESEMYMNDIVRTIGYLSEENKRLYQENKELKSKQYKDEELREQISDMSIEDDFVISENEIKKIEKWHKEHNKQKHSSECFGAIGGELTYLFVPTFIGTIGKVKCCCGEEFIFRDMD